MVLITRKEAYQLLDELIEFPSPCGDYGSYLGLWLYESLVGIDSFRPLAGIMVLIGKEKANTVLEYKTFPSPCGDYGSYHREESRQRSISGRRFPSPCGDYGSYHRMGSQWFLYNGPLVKTTF